MNVEDKDCKIGINSTFRNAIKACRYFYHIAFLETCKSTDIVPTGLIIKQRPFISFNCAEFDAFWEETVKSTQEKLLDTLILGIHDKLLDFELKFWDGVKEIVDNVDAENVSEWFVKLLIELEREERIIKKRKKKKLTKLCDNFDKCNKALSRFYEHLNFYEFRTELEKFV